MGPYNHRFETLIAASNPAASDRQNSKSSKKRQDIRRPFKPHKIAPDITICERSKALIVSCCHDQSGPIPCFKAITSPKTIRATVTKRGNNTTISRGCQVTGVCERITTANPSSTRKTGVKGEANAMDSVARTMYGNIIRNHFSKVLQPASQLVSGQTSQ